ncbi:ABC transporter ATP-binding protein [Bifidobacterium choerinum]|uniref:Peptides ABC transporter ATP-binding protein n=1 Tax=Bifidobacterium choerinum TaxID=35760 RepID=A0A087AI74_9BIFI|nr:dipeptide/oligopeptide/nickel ABC transporter ATP-binding protein [Bifidobacterium choerinum]KFI58474.1 peptides ABC transporter ATP-binding protein [Bifidobacterium choerinum]
MNGTDGRTTAAATTVSTATSVADAPTLLEGIGIHKSFGKGRRRHEVLHGCSIRVHEGECVAVIGGSGSGKSTLTRILLGLEAPDVGDVRFDGEPIASADGRHRLRRASGIVYQDPFSSLDPRWTAFQSVSEPLRLRAHDRGDGGKHDVKHSDDGFVARVCEALRLVALDPQEFLDRYPIDMSGGQAQRVAIARAIVTGPRLLLADEAMSAIDVAARLQILDAFAAVRARDPRMGMLLVSHDLGVVQSIADTIVVLHDGVVVEQGCVAAVLGDPQVPYTRELVAAATL